MIDSKRFVNVIDSFRKTVLLAVMSFIGLPLNVASSAETFKPNIVYIMLDEWGYYELSSLGHPRIETPVIDQVVQDGMRFTQFLAGGCVCAPTRATLMLGKHTGHTSVRRNDGASPIREDEITVGQMLKHAGYATGGFGKWGIGDRGTSGVPEKHGFDLFFGYYNQVHAHTYFPNYLVRNSEKIPLPGNTGHAFEGETFSQYLIHDQALKFIREHAGKEPFFAYLPYTPPHAYYGLPLDDPAYLKFIDKNWDDAPQHHLNPKVAPPDEAKRYAAFVAMMDRQIGEVIETLDETGVADNTILFISGDNGGNIKPFRNEKYPDGFFAPNRDPKSGVTFRGGKGNFYEGGIRVPFIVRWPGRIKAGSVSDFIGYFPDIMPTLADLAGAEIPESSDGISILPTLMGHPNQQKQHEYLYWEMGDERAVRWGDWKAIQNSKSKVFELYRLKDDPSEEKDLAGSHPDIVARMEKFARQAHVPQQVGTVHDKSLGFQGHQAK